MDLVEHLERMRESFTRRTIPPLRITYGSAHSRVRDVRGPAKEYTCLSCGGQAKDWAVNHVGGKALTTDVYTGMMYSIDPDDYIPLCRRCHKLFDSYRVGRIQVMVEDLRGGSGVSEAG
jgi:5-methylcytosine-specific restriction endonuclease McrA